MSEEEIVAERVALHVDQWPTMNEAMGCIDCSFLFRTAQPCCPHCGSASMLNVAELLTRGPDLTKMKHLALMKHANEVTAEIIRREEAGYDKCRCKNKNHGPDGCQNETFMHSYCGPCQAE